MADDKKKIIENLLKKNSDGMTIQDLAEKTGWNRATVMPVLAELRGECRVRVREVGQAKLHYWKKQK